jgi:hypothetical protein
MMFRLATLASVCALLTACASQAPDTAPVAGAAPSATTSEAVPKLPEKAIPIDSVYPLLVAEFALRRRAYDVALDNYMEQSRLLEAPGIRAHATHLAQFMQREDEALEAAQLWVEVEPESVEANNTLATLLTRQGRAVEAIPHLATVGRSGAQAQYPILLNGFRKLDSEQQSLLVAGVNTLSTEFPTDTQLLITQALIHEELGQRKLALTKVRIVFEQEPYQHQAVLLEAKLLVDEGA